MAECIYSNNINKSILTSGFTIPVDKWDIFAKCLGANLQKGERKEIVVWVGQLKCSASYTNVNLTGENAGRTVFQVRYSGDLVSELRKIFSPNSDNYDAVGGKLEVYSGKVGELTFKCLPAVTVNTINEDSAVSTTPGVMNLNTVVTKILNDYVPSKKETFAGHQMGSFFRSDIPLAIYETGIVESAPYLITGSVGQGNWAMIPWVCIFDRKITTTATKGIYIVYLLSKDGNSLYLSFNQGCTDIRKNNSKKDTIRIMREKAEDIRKRIDSRGFNADNNAKLGDGLTELGELYQEGMIFYKEYKKGNVPGESELQNDLRLMMDIYKEYVNGKAENTEIIDVEVGEEQLSTKDTLDQIKKYIAAKGFTFNEGLVENYYLSLKSKPFVILAGTSGTGKTRLVRLFAEAIGATSQNGRYKLVSVRPDWSDSSDLFGHVNLNDKFIPGAIIDFVKQAELDSRNPYFLCLDEMNLARVEYYLSDILSIIETREYVDGKVTTDPLITENYYGADITAKGKYGVVRIPENLYIIGTVNMDETTFPFSRKVLDRANTIEFSTVELLANFDSTQGEVKAIFADNTFMKADYVFFNQCASDKDFVEDVCIELQDINKILEKANAHVGYRVRDEIVFYRYRDAIVYHNGADPYERTMFGAYVLFPYANKEEYRNHKFFESIEKVNIGGLPFLPSETSMVQDMLDALIADSPDSAFERATLPRGIEDKLAKIDWNQRDVLVGALRNRAQLDTCLKYKFYHIPASKIRDADLPIHYVAIYQSINIFGREAGIRYYGEVTKTSAVKRRDIREIPKNSDEAYYRFEIKEWKELNIPLVAKEVRDFPFFTNMFLLQHCPDVPDLHISSEEEYRLYIEVRRLANDASVNETDAEPGFKYDDKTIIMENGDIVVLKDGTKIEQISIETFMRKPRESMRVIAK